MRTNVEIDDWAVVTRINQAGNLAIEVARDGNAHAEVVLQEEGVIDLVTTGSPKQLGPKGWACPGAPDEAMRKYRFEPGEDADE